MLLCPRTCARDTQILHQLSVYLKGKGRVTERRKSKTVISTVRINTMKVQRREELQFVGESRKCIKEVILRLVIYIFWVAINCFCFHVLCIYIVVFHLSSFSIFCCLYLLIWQVLKLLEDRDLIIIIFTLSICYSFVSFHNPQGRC